MHAYFKARAAALENSNPVFQATKTAFGSQSENNNSPVNDKHQPLHFTFNNILV